jgi:CBS domain-containing protein
MTEEVVTTNPHEQIQDAADRFITYDIHHLPVVDSDDHVVGMLSTTDLTAYISGIQEPSPDKAELGA